MTPKRLLIVKLSSLGDIFHALPVVHALRVGLDAEIDWVTQPEYADLVRCFPDVNKVIPFPRHRLVQNFGLFLQSIRSARYDHVIDLQGLLKSAMVSKLARADQVIGPAFHREGSHLLYDRVVSKSDQPRHVVDEAMDVVRLLGLPVLPAEFPVVFPDVEILSARPRVAVLPSSRWGSKNWPVEYYAEVAHLLAHHDDTSIYLMGGDKDRSTCITIQHALESGHACSRIVNLAGRTSLVEMGGWMKTMDLVLANDSGPIHMAAAVNVPVVAMFGPTDPARTGPYGQGHRVLTGGVVCRPCFRRSCRGGVADCMRAISPESVYKVAHELLQGRLS
jgi:heptosyltransferase-1